MKPVRWMMVVALLLATALSHAAGPRAWLDRDRVQLGETLTLNVEVEEAAGSAPDFSPLASDFDILGSQSSRQVSIVNGTRTARTLWAVGLQPKHEGRITIPAITVASQQTAPIELEVLPAAPQEGRGEVFIEFTVDPVTPYVQQQVRATVKLYYAFDLANGNLSEPVADGLVVQRLGKDKSYSAEVGGRRYQVIERHYAFTPERSGALTIAPLAFRGTALDAGDPAGFFGRGRNVGARSQAVRLDVKSRPAEWTGGTWLPAASMLLQDTSELPAQVRVGDPVTRTVRLQAQGLGYEQLPELSFAAPVGADLYPDKEESRTRDDGQWLYGERLRKFAFVPSRPGTLTLPSMRVQWWDTQNDRMAVAELPEREIRVLPAGGAAAPTSSTDASGSASPASAPEAVPGHPVPQGEGMPWRMLAWTGFLLWIATIAAWLVHVRLGPRPTRARAAPPARTDGRHRANFLRACAMGDLAVAEHALVEWAASDRPGLRSIGAIAAALQDEAQKNALASLQMVRYAGASREGLAGQLERAFRGGFGWREAPARAGQSDLPPLYPSDP